MGKYEDKANLHEVLWQLANPEQRGYAINQLKRDRDSIKSRLSAEEIAEIEASESLKPNIYNVEVVAYLSGIKLAGLTSDFLNANDYRCADYNEYGHGEQLARLLLAAYDLGAIEWEPSKGKGDSAYWRHREGRLVQFRWARSLAMAATDLGFDPDEVRVWLAGEARDWACLSEGFEQSGDWDLRYLWSCAQKNHAEDRAG